MMIGGKYQENATPEFHPWKYRIGVLLTFRRYNPQETSVVACKTFRRGDVLEVLPRNGCGMGIDVVRLSDGQVDMVWPEEVNARRREDRLAKARKERER